MAKATRTKKNKAGSAVKQIFQGATLSGDFFTRYWLQIVLVVAMFIGYITNKYQCQTRMETIAELRDELEVVRTEHINQHSIYHSSIRESQMKELVDSLHLDLSIQEQPVYTLQYE